MQILLSATRTIFLLSTLAVILVPRVSPAFVERIEIVDVSALASGQVFGQAGPYVRISGRLHYALDPQDPVNQGVKDLMFAQRGEDGLVRMSGDFVLLRPANPDRGNRVLFYDATNRGSLRALTYLNDAPAGNNASTTEDLGNGFLLNQGYTVLWTGWNWDVQPGDGRLALDAPLVVENGKPATGQVLGEVVTSSRVLSARHVAAFAKGYPPVSHENAGDRLEVRAPGASDYTLIPRGDWTFGRQSNDIFVDDPKWISLKGGFEPGHVYRLVYEGKNAVVVGAGLASIRDALSFFKFADQDRFGNRNPLAGADRDKPNFVLAFGHSQPARLINTMIYEGFHVDGEGRAVIDGALVDVGGAGRGNFNFRFAQTSRHFSPDIDLDFVTDVFPFTTRQTTDPVTGKTAGLFDNARGASAPKVMRFNTSTEYWARSGSLIHTTPDGQNDVQPAPNERIYFLAGGQHFIGVIPSRGVRQVCSNPLDHRPVLRALLTALNGWVSSESEPPESRYPKRANGTLGTLEQYVSQFPTIPGMDPPAQKLDPPRLNYGPRFEEEGLADVIPPERGAPYVTLVPVPNKDGLALGGITMPELSRPLGTYTGWSRETKAGGAPGRTSRYLGSFVPFPPTEATRDEAEDTRASIAQRYRSKKEYLKSVRSDTEVLVKAGFVLDQDIEPIVNRANHLWDAILAADLTDAQCSYLAAP